MPGPTPVPTPDTAPYWEGAAAGELRIQQCTSCSEYYFYPRPFCPKCGSGDVEWRVTSGRASLVSYVINHRPVPPAVFAKHELVTPENVNHVYPNDDLMLVAPGATG